MQNEFITALGLVEWEDEVITLLEKYNVPEAEEIDEDTEDYGRGTEDNLINFHFDNDCATLKQIERKAEENFYLQTIAFDFDLRYYKKDIVGTDIPFGIDEKSDYPSVIATIGEPHFEWEHQELTDPYILKNWIFKNENGEKYEVRVRFVNETLMVHELSLYVYIEDRTYNDKKPHSYDPLKR